jgi:phosphocarrier protein HPr
MNARGATNYMLTNNYLIINKLGLHARASALFVKTASRFAAEVRLSKEGVEVNGKSIMGIMMLAASKGTIVSLSVEGADEAEALQAIGELITNGFGEE